MTTETETPPTPAPPVTLQDLGTLQQPPTSTHAQLMSLTTAPKLPHPGLVRYEAGVKVYDAGDFDAAIVCFKDALKLLPTLVPAWVNLGNCYDKKGQWLQAITFYENAASLEPLLGEAYNNIANSFHKLDMLGCARALTELATKLLPHDSRVRWNRSVFNLGLGLLDRGWDDYDYRFWRPGASSKKRLAPPSYWQGEPLHGKTILVWTEQGLGEIVLYCSMIADATRDAAHVVIETSARLVPVLAQSFPNATVIPYLDPHPPGIDYQIPAGSLGRFVRRRMADFPRHRGYLSVNAGVRQQIRKRLLEVASGKPIVGISWISKNDDFGPGKSVPILEWGEILSKDYCFLSLQYGDVAADLKTVQDLGVTLHEIENCGQNLEEFLAVVDACDLVITVSNTTAHVAGAVNVPAWVMLPRGDARLWHWFVIRPDSPWYPSLRLFRQRTQPQPDRKWYVEPMADIGRALP